MGPIESASYRVIEVAIGGSTALAVSLLVLPTRAHALAIDAAALMLDLMARFLPDLVSGFLNNRQATTIGPIQDSIGQAFARLEAIAGEAKHERIGFVVAGPDLNPLVRTLRRLRHDFVFIGRAAAVPFPETLQARLGPLLAAVTKSAAEYIRRSGDALASRHDPSSPNDVEAALDAYAYAFSAVRSEGLTTILPVDAVERIFTLGFALDQLRGNLHDLERCVKEEARCDDSHSAGLTRDISPRPKPQDKASQRNLGKAFPRMSRYFHR
jgi:hypothetical protein